MSPLKYQPFELSCISRNTCLFCSDISLCLILSHIVIGRLPSCRHLQGKKLFSTLCLLHLKRNFGKWYNILFNFQPDNLRRSFHIPYSGYCPVLCRSKYQHSSSAVGKCTHTFQPVFHAFLPFLLNCNKRIPNYYIIFTISLQIT